MSDTMRYDALKKLASFASETTFDDIPDEVINYSIDPQKTLWQQLGNLAQLDSLAPIFELNCDKSLFTDS